MRTFSGEVEIVPGVVGPEVAETAVTAPASGIEVVAVIRYDAELERYVCEQLTARRGAGGPITAEDLRAIAVVHFIRLAVLLPVLEPSGTPGELRTLEESAIRDLPNPDGREPWGRRPPEGLAEEGPTDRVLRWVAHIYRCGLAVEYTPTKAVEETLQLSRPTAGRWVAKARERGYLGPAEVGKAG